MKQSAIMEMVKEEIIRPFLVFKHDKLQFPNDSYSLWIINIHVTCTNINSATWFPTVTHSITDIITMRYPHIRHIRCETLKSAVYRLAKYFYNMTLLYWTYAVSWSGEQCRIGHFLHQEVKFPLWLGPNWPVIASNHSYSLLHCAPLQNKLIWRSYVHDRVPI